MALQASAGILTFTRTMQIKFNGLEHSHGINLVARFNCMWHIERATFGTTTFLKCKIFSEDGSPWESHTHARSANLVCCTLQERRQGGTAGEAGERRGSSRATGELSLTPEQY